MAKQNRSKSRTPTALEKATEKYLKENPQYAEALRVFGITNEQYQRAILAQQKPVFYTVDSTT